LLQNMRQLVLIRDIDEELAAVDEELARIPEERQSIEGELALAGEALAQAKQLLADHELEERRLEASMSEQEALLERLNAQTSQVASPQAYEALQHEIEHASGASSEFETRALELMEAIDRERGEVAAAQERLRRAEEETPARLDELIQREKRRAAERETLVERRQKSCQRLDSRLLAHYERIALKRRPAVGVFEAEVCPVCGVAVPTQRASEIRGARAVYACSGCHRLLVPAQALRE
jgi:predicted  nucleic acid-binding Zn-ribbon protein